MTLQVLNVYIAYKKIHKKLVDGFPKCLPVISQIVSPTYKIAKYLLDFISPMTKNEYTLKDSFEHVHD